MKISQINPSLDKLDPSLETKFKVSYSQECPIGWSPYDTKTSATYGDDCTKIPPARALSIQDSFVPNNDKVNPKEVISLLEASYNDISLEKRNEVDVIIADVSSGKDLLNRHMETLSIKIDEALRSENPDYEQIHAMVLRFCMIHMRNVVKEDHDYIEKIGDQIKVQSGKIKDSYNTWPVVTVTLVSSALSIAGGLAGFSSAIRPNSDWAKTFTTNAHGISTIGTGLSGAGSLLSSGAEGKRGVLQLTLKRYQDKEEEKKGSKHSTKESQKGFRSAIEEYFRSIRETIRSILGG